MMEEIDRSVQQEIRTYTVRKIRTVGTAMLNLQRMRLLVELSRRGTLAEVADALAYSRSSVSQQLSQLQVEAGVQLIEPAGRGIRLTTAGEILVRHAEQILRQVDRAEADLAATRSEISGELRLATFQTAAIAMIPDLLQTMTARHPLLTIFLTEIQPDAGTAALLAGKFDLVLGEQYPGLGATTPSSIDRQPLFADPLRLWVGRNQQRWIGHQLSDFAEADWVLEPPGKPARAWAETICRSEGFDPRVRFESADLLVHAQLVETGHATALVPDLLWRSRPPTGRSIRLPADPRRDVYTAVRRGAETRPALVELRSALAEIVMSHAPTTPG
jgi:DNA-binding transcriptional LysR family regulator